VFATWRSPLDKFVWEEDEVEITHARVLDYNPYHEPAGSEKGGEFSSGTGLSGGEQRAVDLYTGAGDTNSDGHYRINSFLRGQERYADKETRTAIKNLTTLTERSKLSAMTGYRGISNPPQGLMNLKIGSEFTDKGFVSVSGGRDIAAYHQGDDGIMVEIAIPAGAKGIDLQKSSSYSEDEKLLARGSRFRVTALDKKSRIIKVDLL
jgi:hypothetical protein